MNKIRLLERVIDALCEAREGGRELDGRIALALGGSRSDSAKLLNLFLEEGYDWQTVSALLDAQIPVYTTSLDAAVPGESIVGVLYSERRDRWAAVHRASDGAAGEPVWAASEARMDARATFEPGVEPSAEPRAKPGADPGTELEGEPEPEDPEFAETDSGSPRKASTGG